MAQLIPSFIEDTSPDGERAVFNMLAGGPSGWLIFHSLDLAPWNGRRRTEIDFVVVVPDSGILCIEVKSHSEIGFDGSVWHPTSIRKSPFKQAADAAFALHRRLKGVSKTLGAIPVVHSCVFPNARLRLGPSLVLPEHELMDVDTFRSFTDGQAFCQDIRLRLRKSIELDPALDFMSQSISPGSLTELAGLLAPVSIRQPDRRDQIEARYHHLDGLLRPQQKVVLNLVQNNPRVLVRGPAGTGKTQIALEVARRRAEAGDRVALLCFNRLIGDWMQHQVSSWNPMPNLIVDRAIRLMAQLCAIEVPSNPGADFWDNALPDAIEEAITSPGFRPEVAFDYLVVDEAQDILARPRLWQSLMQFVEGGESEGRFCLFGDFDYQTLSGHAVTADAVGSLQRAGCVTFSLAENCRNFRLIGGVAVAIAGMPSDVYSAYLRTGGSIADLMLAHYADSATQVELLATALRRLKADGYKPSEVTILSCCEPSASAASRLSTSGFALAPVGGSGNHTHFTSVHAFKGLENRAVIITDIADLSTLERRHALYVGMTRATGPLTLLYHKDVGDALVSTLSQALNAGTN